MPDTRVSTAIFHPVVTSASLCRAGAIIVHIAPESALYFANIDAARAFLRDANQALARPAINEPAPERAAQDNHQTGDAAHGDSHLGAVEPYPMPEAGR